MAEYELPPLRIKIVGDGKSWERTAEQTIKQAKQLAASLEKIGSTVKASVINKSVRQAITGIHSAIASHISNVSNNLKIAKGLGTQGVRKAMRDAVGNILAHVSLHIEQVASLTSRLKLGGGAQVNKTMREATRLILHYILIGIRRMVVSAHSVRVAGASQVNKTMRDANKLVLHYILIGIRRMVVSAHSVKTAGSGMVNKVMRQALDVILHSLITRIRLMAVTAHTVRGSAAPLKREVRSGINTIINYIILAVRGTIVQALAGINIKQFVNNLRKGLQSGLNSARWSPSNTGKAGRGGGGFGMLGDRADIYMHLSAVRSLAGAWREPLRLLSEYQTNIASLAPLLGGQDQARAFVDSNRMSMVGQVYGAEALTASVRFLGANMSLSETKTAMESIGNLAAGNAERFQGLARAFSQVAAQGNLQGDELEQLAEQNFPLLQIMAQRTGKSLSELRELMAKRAITSKAVFATLKAETAQGGKYAGVLNEMSQKLPGATARVAALFGVLRTKVMETAEKELAKYVNMLAQLLQKSVEWVSKNPETVKGYVMLALRVSAAVVAFHALGFAVALVHWQIYTLGRIMAVVTGAITAFKYALMGAVLVSKRTVAAIAAIRIALMGLRISLLWTAASAAAAWIAATLPVSGTALLIAGIVAVVAALGLLIWWLVNPEGLYGAFKFLWSYIGGFFGFLWSSITAIGSYIAESFGEGFKSAFASSEDWLKSMGITGDFGNLSPIPEQDGTDINSLFGPGKADGVSVRNGGLDAISVKNVAEQERRLENFQMQMSGKTKDDKLIQNTGKTNDILMKIHNKMSGNTTVEALQ